MNAADTSSGDKLRAFAESVLEIDLLPWQVDALDVVLNGNIRAGSLVLHPRRAGRRTGIEQMNAVLDELRDRATWLLPEVELASVYQVAAKYLPEPTRHADILEMRRVLDLVV